MLDTLKHMSMEQLRDTHSELHHIYEHPHTPEHVRQGAAALINFYSAEIDARMMNGEWG